MPQFIVTVSRVLESTAEFIITASNEDKAQELAERIMNDDTARDKQKLDWELEDESYEVLEVNEE